MLKECAVQRRGVRRGIGSIVRDVVKIGMHDGDVVLRCVPVV